jgi:hypothetical protein
MIQQVEVENIDTRKVLHSWLSTDSCGDGFTIAGLRDDFPQQHARGTNVYNKMYAWKPIGQKIGHMRLEAIAVARIRSLCKPSISVFYRHVGAPLDIEWVQQFNHQIQVIDFESLIQKLLCHVSSRQNSVGTIVREREIPCTYIHMYTTALRTYIHNEFVRWEHPWLSRTRVG